MSVSFEQMRAARPGVFSPQCATRLVLDHVMSRWGVLVLWALTGGTKRWGTLRRDVEGISEKMLAATLRQLTADGLVHRDARATVPPHVEYRLTERGQELMALMLPLMEWIANNADEIATPQPAP
ncbi:winged helix-turn-helix transcriptional regulator [Kribbia dieselivorans]|uniref:winged helix-turn-helix transcriptional regulator n=1 Tax=Kribbia dieselivorans TaxID=331526 RepID=UPI00083905A3|nr:helix-turn-helix domain-containing protein [Kribbia dieselivorans]